jgi:hypothetical protein
VPTLILALDDLQETGGKVSDLTNPDNVIEFQLAQEEEGRQERAAKRVSQPIEEQS